MNSIINLALYIFTFTSNLGESGLKEVLEKISINDVKEWTNKNI